MCYRLLLTDYGARNEKIPAMRVLRSTLSVSLRVAKEWCDQVDRGAPFPVIYESMSRERAAEMGHRLSESPLLTVVMVESKEFDMPTAAEISLAIWIARELPIKPNDLRIIAQRISESDNPVASLERVANMIETAA